MRQASMLGKAAKKAARKAYQYKIITVLNAGGGKMNMVQLEALMKKRKSFLRFSSPYQPALQ